MWQLIINGPGYFDTPYDLPEGVTLLGRADENDIVLSGDLVSRRHARFRVNGDELTVEDMGSRNGSKLNGQPLKGTVSLKPGDTVNVGENALAVRQPSKVEGAATEVVNLDAGGVRRYGRGADIGGAVITSRNLRESVVLRALDNVTPFDPGAGPMPFGEQPTSAVTTDFLLTLYRMAEQLSSATSLQAFLEQTADRVMERTGATTAVVLLKHPTGAMVPAAVRHSGKLSRGEVPVSDAIIDAALSSGSAIAVADVREDSRFAARESVIMYGANQVLCIPIRGAGGKEFLGVLYLNRPAGNPEELAGLLDLCTAMTHLLSTGLQRFRAQGNPAAERLRRTLERFHPPEVAERRLDELGRGAQGPVTGLEDRPCTVLVADLVGLGPLAQQPAMAGKLLNVLNDFNQRLCGVVFSFDGTMVGIVGETLVALFGAPAPRQDDPLRAVRCALALRAEWERTLERHPPEVRPLLRMGLHTGRALLGLVGSASRLDFAVLGEPLKLASSLRETAEAGQILITGKTLAAVGARFDVVPLGERVLPGAEAGRKERTAAFEVIEEDVAQHTMPGVR